MATSRVFFSIERQNLIEPQLAPLLAHAVTAGLTAAFADEGDEELDLIVQLAAADDNLRTVSNERSRLVVAADAEVEPAGSDEDPSLVTVREPIAWAKVAAIFADAPEAADDVLRARTGDEAAWDACAGWEMLWYHPSERTKLAEDLA